MIRSSVILLATLCVLACTAEPNLAFRGLSPEIWYGTAESNGVVAFKGLPFAAPPVGELRWQPPAPYVPVAGQHDANEFAAACMQGTHTVDWYQDLLRSLGKDPAEFSHPAAGYNEDCLYLNIWTPELAPAEPLPVMVWIHGGSNKGGWAFEPDYRGARLAAEGVVVVSVAYRVGIFGFFAHPELIQSELPQKEGDQAGNYGLLDLLAGLGWVQQHIKAFGGDPNNVTVFGESAGAANIGYLMSSPASKGLFHRAIHQSAGFQLEETQTLQEQGRTGARLAASLAGNLTSLRYLPADELLSAADQLQPSLEYAPAAGGSALPHAPDVVFAAGEQLRVPLLIGTNQNEWLMYIAPEQSAAGTISDILPGADLEVVAEQFAGRSDLEIIDRVITGQQMRCPSYAMASAMVAGAEPAWVYHLGRVREGEHWQAVGAYHGAEIPYVFATHADWLATDARDLLLTDIMQGYWVNFARTGNPNGPGLPGWAGWAQPHAEALVLGAADAVQSDAPGSGAMAVMQPAPDDWLCGLLEQN